MQQIEQGQQQVMYNSTTIKNATAMYANANIALAQSNSDAADEDEEASFHEVEYVDAAHKDYNTPNQSRGRDGSDDTDELSAYLMKLEKPQNYFLEDFHAPRRKNRRRGRNVTKYSSEDTQNQSESQGHQQLGRAVESSSDSSLSEISKCERMMNMPESVLATICQFLLDENTSLPGLGIFIFSMLCKKTQAVVSVAFDCRFRANTIKENFIVKMRGLDLIKFQYSAIFEQSNKNFSTYEAIKQLYQNSGFGGCILDPLHLGEDDLPSRNDLQCRLLRADGQDAYLLDLKEI